MLFDCLQRLRALRLLRPLRFLPTTSISTCLLYDVYCTNSADFYLCEDLPSHQEGLLLALFIERKAKQDMQIDNIINDEPQHFSRILMSRILVDSAKQQWNQPNSS